MFGQDDSNSSKNWERDKKSSIIKETNNSQSKFVENKLPEVDDDDDNETSNVDLDTRIAMLFKGKTFGNAPPFLQLSDSEDEETNNDPEENKASEVDDISKESAIKSDNNISPKDSPISKSNVLNIRPPSPECKKEVKPREKNIKSEIKIDEGASDISSSDDEILLAKGSYSPVLLKPQNNTTKIKNEDDQMSLSSLSSNEPNKMEDETQPPPPPAEKPPPPPPPSSPPLNVKNAPNPPTPYFYPPTTPSSSGINNNTISASTPAQGFPYYPQGYSYQSAYLPQTNTHGTTPYTPTSQNGTFMIQPQGFSGAPAVPLIPQYNQAPYFKRDYTNDYYNHYTTTYTNYPGVNAGSLNMRTNNSMNANKDDPYALQISLVIERVTTELKQILKKDFNKKMIENTAYKKYETWWDDEARNNNNKLSSDNVDTKAMTSTLTSSVATNNKIEKAPDINQLLACNRENFDSLGLGLRATIPKMPSFRRIRKAPSPKRQDDDEQKSDQEDMVQGSDSEKETEVLPVGKTAYSRTITTQSSITSSVTTENSRIQKREGSTSSFFSSSSEEETSSDEESSSETSSLSDGDMDNYNDVRKSVPTIPVKSKIYSDSDSDISDDLDIKQNQLKLSNRPKPATFKQKIYSDSEESDSTSAAIIIPKQQIIATRIRAESNHLKTLDSLHEDLSDDDEDLVLSPKDSQPPRTPGRDESPKKISPLKSSYDLNRVYSDSDEEREFQEKRRRNTEYMEEVEREVKEEFERKRKEMEESKTSNHTNSNNGTVDSSNDQPPSPSDPQTPILSKPPPTPGARLIINEPLAQFKDAKPNNNQICDITETIEKLSKKEKKISNGLSATQTNVVVAEGGTTKSFDNIANNSTTTKKNNRTDIKLSPTSSDGGSSQASQASQVALEHCYSLPPSASPSSQDEIVIGAPGVHNKIKYATFQKTQSTTALPANNAHLLAHDHGYTTNNTKENEGDGSSIVQLPRPVGRPRKDSSLKVLNNQHKKYEHSQSYISKKAKKEALKRKAQEQIMPLEPFIPEKKFEARDGRTEMSLLYDFLTRGIDFEDIRYLKSSYEILLQDDANNYWLNATHWVDHCATDRNFVAPPKKRKKGSIPEPKIHPSGSARTEGFYKIDSTVKAKYKYHHLKGTLAATHLDKIEEFNVQKAVASKMQGISREARSNQRRLLTAFGASTESELLKFNQLKFRKKQLKFAKSAIHDWGLFAMEPIAADEMVIEYVGQMVRPSVADLRETKYEAIGIGSSYLFRIDMETIIDATKCGNLARFINHSCNVSNLLPFLNLILYFIM